MTPRPRLLVHRGTVNAAAFVLDDTPHARGRVLARWKPGVEISRLGARLLWRLLEPQRIACDAAPGLPLVEVEGRLLGAPLEPSELRALGAAAGEVVTVEGSAFALTAPGQRIDVSTWLDVTAFTLVSALEPLGEPPPPPSLAWAPAERDGLRAAAGVPTMSLEAQGVVAAMQGQAPARGDAPPRVGPLGRAVVSALRWVTSLFRRGGASTQGAQGGSSPAAAAPPRRWPLLERLDRWLDRVLDVSRLSSILGRRQAEYLSRLMDMFDQGDLDAALKHAVPLGGSTTDAGRRSLSLPTPRTSLALSGGARPAGASIVMQNDYYEQLRRKYRQAAERLEQQGRYAEAAFVLAELLHVPDDAVAMLERHQQYKLAAELAESRELAVGLQVRLWFLAKNPARAIAVARRHHAFADAVLRLERSHHDEEAQQLRLHWGNALAAAGDFQNAVMSILPIAGAKGLALRWAELGIAQGGAAGARLRIKKLALGAHDPSDVAALIADLENDDPEKILERFAVATGLRDDATGLGALARPIARAAVRAGLRDGMPADATRQALLALSSDGALKADLPSAAPQLPRLHTVSPVMARTFAASDKGAIPVHQAAWLPDGKMLLALGEAGVRLVTREGKTAAHFDVPASQLVTYDAGGRALCLARRGEAWLVTRIDVLQRSVEPLGQLAVSRFAEDTDGSMWFVAYGGSIAGLDLQTPGLKALWRVPDAPAVLGLTRNAFSFSMLCFQGQQIEWWRYELPSLTLRVRQQVDVANNGGFSITAAGNLFGANPQSGNIYAQASPGQPLTRGVTAVTTVGVVPALKSAGEWGSAVSTQSNHSLWQLFDIATATTRWMARIEGQQTASIRMRGDVATWADTEGRVLAVDLGTGRLLRDLRVR